ncbi:hypothetical protein EDB84DRAFT_318476 [Lactarius hengduanensis]|nr:hypothetical protein EDB84DRAFT_318476 [Lactarius hengduanensis]
MHACAGHAKLALNRTEKALVGSVRNSWLCANNWSFGGGDASSGINRSIGRKRQIRSIRSCCIPSHLITILHFEDLVPSELLMKGLTGHRAASLRGLLVALNGAEMSVRSHQGISGQTRHDVGKKCGHALYCMYGAGTSSSHSCISERWDRNAKSNATLTWNRSKRGSCPVSSAIFTVIRSKRAVNSTPGGGVVVEIAAWTKET